MTRRSLSLSFVLVLACNRGPTPTISSTDASTTAATASSNAGDSPFARHKADCAEPKADACVLLGVDYAFGRGVAKDDVRAVQLYRAACDAKNKTGCGFLGTMYRFGRGVPKEKWRARGIPVDTMADIAKKVTVYQDACDAGEATSCSVLAALYERGGEGITKDAAKGTALNDRTVQLYKADCEKNDLMACAALGGHELSGNGVAQNHDQAVAHFEKACEGGDASGCLSLGYVYQQGSAGRTKDTTKSATYFVRACEGGEDMGCENAGHIYEDGRGIKADKKLAQRVYKLACDRGDDAACGAYKRVGGT